MLKRRLSMGLCVVLACVFTLTGCGVEMIELKPEERQQIIDYSAHVIGEFNTRQTKGYIALSKEKLDALNNKDEQADSDNKTDKDDEGQSGQTQDGNTQTSTGNLTQALGIEGVVADNLVYRIESEYTQPDVASVVPSKNKKLVVVECELFNTTSQEVLCDIYGTEMEFTIDVNNGAVEKGSLITFLDNDLSTMSEKLAAGEKKKMMLFFEIPAEMENSIESIALNVKNASTNHTIFMN